MLLAAGQLKERGLRAALERQRREGGLLGGALLAYGYSSEEAVWAALSTQWSLPLRPLATHWVDRDLADRIAPSLAIQRGILPLRARGQVAAVAMTDPSSVSLAEAELGMRVVPVLATPTAVRARQEAVYREQLVIESTQALHRLYPDDSAQTTLVHSQRVALAVLGALSVVGLAILGSRFFIVLSALLVFAYALAVGFRCYVSFRGGRSESAEEVTAEEAHGLADLPVYTILCPLYREAGVLTQLVRACRALDYPKSRLDIKLLLEADDLETLEAVRRFRLPAYFDVVVVPAEGPRTKPKACNYGLLFARGDYTVIFDAEDMPERDQLRKALVVFARHGAEAGCVQAKLNYYNARQNLLTGWFALEYTAWFDFFLPGLVERRLPIPLGGSSNHFPTALLREIGGWDPNNVTEDAELGMRLHRTGRRALMVDSTTWEEANSDFVNWMKQRSRWGKGYFITWLVQMRHPRQLLRQVGVRSFLAIQLTLGGTYAISLLNLFVWTLTALWILAKFDFITFLFPPAIYYLGMLELIFGNFLFVYLGLWASAHRRTWELDRVALVVPFYWLMISLAMVKATFQLFTNPTFWEKTVHGLYTLPGAKPADEGI